MNINNIVLILTSILGSGGVLTYLFYQRKLKKDQQAKANEIYTQKRIEALLEVQIVIDEMNEYELINLVHPEFFGTGFEGIKNDHWAYKTIMESKESLRNFVAKVMKVRGDNQHWLSNKLAASLLFLESYILRMQDYFRCGIFGEDIYPYGLIFYNDLDDIYKYILEIINDNMNTPLIENETHAGEAWEFEKEDIEIRYRNTVLNRLEDGDEETMNLLAMMEYVYKEKVLDEK